jgi:hypothetical protein
LVYNFKLPHKSLPKSKPLHYQLNPANATNRRHCKIPQLLTHFPTPYHNTIAYSTKMEESGSLLSAAVAKSNTQSTTTIIGNPIEIQDDDDDDAVEEEQVNNVPNRTTTGGYESENENLALEEADTDYDEHDDDDEEYAPPPPSPNLDREQIVSIARRQLHTSDILTNITSL